MCGIAGWVDKPEGSRTALDIAAKMSAALRHRGPDGTATWNDESAGAVLVHRRLAVLELGDAGRQPMESQDGRWVLTFNGEIYNHQELRASLGKIRWRGSSDTETLLEAIAAWGVHRTLRAAVGMFAIALWDKAERRLILARDRFGEKPLYWGIPNGTVLFGSELKALWCHPNFDSTLDRDTLASLLRKGYTPGIRTIYRAVQKISPGHYVTIRWVSGVSEAVDSAFWSLDDTACSPTTPRSDAEAIETARVLISEAVRIQLVADVPVGAFLSGGIDSSLVVALAQQLTHQPIQTFTIDFAEPGYTEARHAAVVANHLGTVHHSMLVTPQDAREVIPSLPFMYDEPLGDASQIPTALVASLARRSVTVALSGDGGDELFGGYPRYVREPQLWSQVSSFPESIRTTAGSVLEIAYGALPLGVGGSIGRLRDRLGVYAPLLVARDVEDFFDARLSYWPASAQVVQGRRVGRKVPRSQPRGSMRSAAARMMRVDAHTFLTNDVLVKVDRAAMAASLETRAPLLDHRVADFAFSLDDTHRVRGFETKWLLRRLLADYVPDSITTRPKMGFGVPIAAWLRGPLRNWAEDLLSAERLERQGWLNSGAVRCRWLALLNGADHWDGSLWAILAFQSWLDNAPAT
jgi:asparagine synthase (glutamine-hydrolysing)